MASFRDMVFTSAEFANIAQIDRSMISVLERKGLLKTVKKRVGSADRKMVPLEELQNYFRAIRAGRHGDQDGPDEHSHAAGVFPAKEPSETQLEEGSQKEPSETPEPSELQEQSSVTSEPVQAVDTQEKEMMESQYSHVSEKPRHKIQVFYNVKGGTGKSTITAQYAMKAAMLGLKVLAIDLDGQGHLTVNLDILDAHERPTVYDILINDLPIQDAILNVAPGLDLVPANLGLCNIEIPLNNKARREYRLSEAIQKIADDYDLIVADTNPAASILNGSMLVAAELVNVVCATNPLSFHGMSLVISTIEEMEREFQHSLDVRIVTNMYDNREVISQEVLGELRSQFPEQCTHAVVNRSADLNEATKRRSSVWGVNSKGAAARDIRSLTEELLST